MVGINQLVDVGPDVEPARTYRSSRLSSVERGVGGPSIDRRRVAKRG
jgi:hypothetical protein